MSRRSRSGLFCAGTDSRSDDINKFLWMVRIAQGEWPDEVQEANFFTQRGEFAVDERA